MPQRMKRVFRPKHGEVIHIEHHPSGKRADLIGIHQGREEVRFFLSLAQENIMPGKKTSGGWRYQTIPKDAELVSFNVSYDQHPKVPLKIISVSGFFAQDGQEISMSRE